MGRDPTLDFECPHCGSQPGAECSGPGVVAGAHARRRDVAAFARVKVGQVWADCDRRVKARHLLVLAIDLHGIVRCAVIGTTRETSIMVHRFRPTSTGYRLVEELRGGADRATKGPAVARRKGGQR
jgi:hypothetical protein